MLGDADEDADGGADVEAAAGDVDDVDIAPAASA